MTHNVRTTYYYFGGQRVGMRQNSEVYWLHGDHRGSASLTTNITGGAVSEMRYYSFGETRWMSGTLPTDRLFTGQRAEANTGLYDYNARMYSPSLGRFISADTIVPSQRNPQSVNRYSYVIGNPVNHIDPTGNDCDDGPQTYKACYGNEQNSNSVVRAVNTPNGSWTYSQVRAWKLANGNILQNFDPTEDRNGILLGARLWETYGVNGISPNEQQFIAALQATPGLNRR